MHAKSIGRKAMLATALVGAVGAIGAGAAPAHAGPPPFPNCQWIDCPPPREPVTLPPIKPPGPVCLSCPFELRDVLAHVVLPERIELVGSVLVRERAAQLERVGSVAAQLQP